MNYKYKLTVALPVYNGGVTLARLLESLINQQNEKVEFLLINNNSTDNTEDIVFEFMDKGLKLNYIKQIDNVGPDLNFLNCVEKSKGEYVWLVGHDDYLHETAIDKVLAQLQENLDCAALVTDFSLKENGCLLVENYIGINESISVYSPESLIASVGLDFNFLSCVVHKRDLFLSAHPHKYFKSNWLQLGVFLEYIENQKVCLLAFPVVINAGNSIDGDANVGGKSIKVILNLLRISMLFKDVYGENYTNLAKRYIFRHLNRKIAIAKRTPYKVNMQDYKLFFIAYAKNPFFWFVTTPLYVLPRPIHVGLYALYKQLNLKSLAWKLFR